MLPIAPANHRSAFVAAAAAPSFITTRHCNHVHVNRHARRGAASRSPRAAGAARMCAAPDALDPYDGVFHAAFPAPADGAVPVGEPVHLEAGDAAGAVAADGGGGGDSSNGSGSGSGSGRGGSGEGDDGEEDGEGDGQLPGDMRAALAAGILGREAVARYRAAARNPLLALLLSAPAFRTRFLADSAFLFKLLVQEVVGNGTALASEIAVRGRDIVHELEYVASDLIVGTVIEASFVWVLAPRLAAAAGGSSASSTGWLSRVLADLPANLFQPDLPGRVFTPAQRLGAFVYGAAQYGAIGFAAGIVGTAITYALLETRKALDPKYVPERPQPAVLPNAAGWAAFMVLSANTRFQLVEGLEIAVARVFARSDAVRNLGIIALRLGNNYWGGVQFVKFFRMLGLHATGEDESAEHGEKEKEKEKVTSGEGAKQNVQGTKN